MSLPMMEDKGNSEDNSKFCEVFLFFGTFVLLQQTVCIIIALNKIR